MPWYPAQHEGVCIGPGTESRLGGRCQDEAHWIKPWVCSDQAHACICRCQACKEPNEAKLPTLEPLPFALIWINPPFCVIPPLLMTVLVPFLKLFVMPVSPTLKSVPLVSCQLKRLLATTDNEENVLVKIDQSELVTWLEGLNGMPATVTECVPPLSVTPLLAETST